NGPEVSQITLYYTLLRQPPARSKKGRRSRYGNGAKGQVEVRERPGPGVNRAGARAGHRAKGRPARRTPERGCRRADTISSPDDAGTPGCRADPRPHASGPVAPPAPGRSGWPAWPPLRHRWPKPGAGWLRPAAPGAGRVSALHGALPLPAPPAPGG